MICVEEVFAPVFHATRVLLAVDSLPVFVRHAGEALLALETGSTGDRPPRAPLTWVLARPKMLQMVEPRFDELCACHSLVFLVLSLFAIVL